MTTTYADEDELEARLSATYQVPDNAEELLRSASELIDFATMGRAEALYVAEDGEDEQPFRETLVKAVCDQVEFWLEVGEEHDIAGLKGSLVAGRLQVHPVPGQLGQRARRTLIAGGLFWAGVASA